MKIKQIAQMKEKRLRKGSVLREFQAGRRKYRERDKRRDSKKIETQTAKIKQSNDLNEHKVNNNKCNKVKGIFNIFIPLQ